MNKNRDTTLFENKLLDFVAAKNPLTEMIQWIMESLVQENGKCLSNYNGDWKKNYAD